ncbi:lipoprotein [Providencia vermicola]|uniref:LPS-assembly lipoprotein LptM n=2 Tax=Providencia TaxID=586 RepID=A0AAI9HWY5_PROST|nr:MULTISPECIES: lipoprotein [Providencia]ELR5044483.1 lipoprotein [Providencia rettgeri]ELR5034385.1 lipoprotein [Providencia stuartii]ELR5121558.1 lipoprotein [Providencia stuartii]ELR5141912.1 lipoprotein [Providencia stuartii]ELR5291764.1 lipoprotein [Providencia stuartii]
MKKSLVGLSAFIMLLTLSGCGLKGPLYFPPEEQASASQTEDVEPKAQNSTAADSRAPSSNQQ